jgi:hypothetical protein
MLRKEEIGDNTLTTQTVNLGAPRKRNMLEEDEEDRLHGTKRFFQVPTLEECLGKDNLQRRREEEAEAFIRGVCANGGGITDYVSVEEIGSNVGGDGNKISTDVIGKEKMQVGTLSWGSRWRRWKKWKRPVLGLPAHCRALMMAPGRNHVNPRMELPRFGTISDSSRTDPSRTEIWS